MIFVISFAALVACYNYCVIESYDDNYNKQYKDLWHYLQSAMVVLVLLWHVTTLKEFISFGLIYYVIFETMLNLLRGLHPFYVSKDGSKSDKIRYKLYGENPENKEAILKTILILIAIWLRQNQ
jgi:hypothetical protein